ncbi:MAG TPA: hypothetical protein VN521_02670 [Negativicutes bacterium]|nr:hypothetical protein [Negativicutes bacterium]
MDYAAAITAELAVLRHLGYTEPDVARVVGIYSGYPDWRGLSQNQQRRLAADLKRHTGIARRWHFAVAESTDNHWHTLT